MQLGIKMSSAPMPTSALLNNQEKHLLKKALFTYAKKAYLSDGDLPKHDQDLIYRIAEKLHLR